MSMRISRKAVRLFSMLAVCTLSAGLLTSCGSPGTPSAVSPSSGDGTNKASSAAASTNGETEKTPLERSVLWAGNSDRIAAVMKKAAAGEPIIVSVIGGSITAGASADAGKAYGDIMQKWWKDTFPDNTVMFVNAGIGATDSIFGAHRVQNDLLAKKPDFVVVEFSVNDTGVANAKEAYEGLMRQILSSAKVPGVLAVATCSNSGNNWQDAHLEICKNYDIPFLSFKNAYMDSISKGADPDLSVEKIWADELHPTNFGHSLLGGLITDYLDTIYAEKDHGGEPVTALPAPVTDNGYEKAVILDNAQITPAESTGWNTAADGFWGNGWKTSTPGSRMKFEIGGGYITFYFKRTVADSGGTVQVIVDGKTDNPVTVDAAFPGGWGDYKASIDILHDAADKGTHTVEIVFGDGNTAGKEFFLCSIAVANSQ